MSSVVYVIFVAVLVAITLWGETRFVRPAVWIAKPLASTGFVALALSLGAMETLYGRIVVVALCLSWLGDVLLIPKTRPAFLAGLVSFLLGHAGFAVAFVVRGIDPMWTAVGLAALLIPAVVIVRWLLPHLDSKMRPPVLSYVVVITAMVALAAGAYGAGSSGWILVAAIAFFISDIAVAKEAFVSPHPLNRIWGLPIYYGAQVGFAFTVTL